MNSTHHHHNHPNPNPNDQLGDKFLNAYICIDSCGEVKVNHNVSKCLRDKKLAASSAQRNENDTHNEEHRRLYSKIVKKSKVSLNVRNCYEEKVFSVPSGLVKRWARSMSLVSVPGLYTDLDLESGRYEGGFKVWESTKDLVKFVTEDYDFMSTVLDNGHSRLRVLELGAGAALPSIALLSRLIEDPNFKSSYQIHVQDFNWQVLASLTLMNFAFNYPLDFFEKLLETRCLRFFCGDWKDFKAPYKYDLIMMSEVLYNSNSYESLHNLLVRHSTRETLIVIATKDTYFGLSGSLFTWQQYVESRNTLSIIKIGRVYTTNIPRSIIVMKKKALF